MRWYYLASELDPERRRERASMVAAMISTPPVTRKVKPAE